MKTLGKLERVPIRQVWPDEANDFTPWLCGSDGLGLLSETVGIDLEVIERESPVGGFRLDILARQEGTEELVVIENQFGDTDHKHLGQLLTYAAGVGTDGSGARTVIWIAERFCDAHKNSLDWLNRTTDPGIRFFGVEIQAWNIGSSDPAPMFRIVREPNDWQKDLNKHVSVVTAGDELYAAFWAYFIEESRKQGTPLRFASPQGKHWLFIPVGRSGFNISLVASKQSSIVRCELYISGSRAKTAFFLLEQEAGKIRSELGEDLIFDELPKKIACRIYLQRTGDVTDKTNWPELQNWLKGKAEAFLQTFSNRVKNLDLDNLPDSSSAEQD